MRRKVDSYPFDPSPTFIVSPLPKTAAERKVEATRAIKASIFFISAAGALALVAGFISYFL